MICRVFSAFHVDHHHDQLADMMVNMKPSQSNEDKAPRPGLAQYCSAHDLIED